MKQLYLVLFFLPVISVSCDSTAEKAQQFNKQLIIISDSLNQKGKRVGEMLATGLATKDFSGLNEQCNSALQYIDEKISFLKNREDENGSEGLTQAMISFLEYEKEMISQGFAPFGEMDSTTSQEKIESTLVVTRSKVKDEQRYLLNVRKAQRQFAAQNGLKME